MKRNFLTMRDRLHVAAFIDANTAPDGDGFIKYINGITNDTAAAEVLTKALGREVSKNHVLNMRQQTVGNLRRGGATPGQMAKLRAKAAAKRAAKRKPLTEPANASVIGALNDLRAEVSDLSREVNLLRGALWQERDVPKFARKNGGSIHAAE
jgi:hypothetical protein